MVDTKKQRAMLRNLLEPIMLQLIKNKPMHGYEIIDAINKNFGHHFGPSTTYPLLTDLEENNYISKHWDMKTRHPRKIYHITEESNNILTLTEQTINLIFQKTNTPTTNNI
jgi:DNA-binding PadR family transcriptional regulator